METGVQANLPRFSLKWLTLILFLSTLEQLGDEEIVKSGGRSMFTSVGGCERMKTQQKKEKEESCLLGRILDKVSSLQNPQDKTLSTKTYMNRIICVRFVYYVNDCIM